VFYEAQEWQGRTSIVYGKNAGVCMVENKNKLEGERET